MKTLWLDRRPRIVCAHPLYDLKAALDIRQDDSACTQVFSLSDLDNYIEEAEILCISMLWKDYLLDRAPRLKLVQSISAGVDHFPQKVLQDRNIPLCSARGVNARAVSEHVLSFILNISRRLFEARDDQKAGLWRTPVRDATNRVQELTGKRVLVVGLGSIGRRVAHLCQAFDMTVTGVRRTVVQEVEDGIHIVASDRLHEAVAEADFVVLSCPLTPETHGLVDAAFLSSMRRDAYLINVSRGKVVDEAALLDALDKGTIAGAALDTFVDEPLPEGSTFWSRENVIVTPHNAGDSQFYARNVVDILLDNITNMENGTPLRNRVV
ncbi:D-2-hydroxyacid dehydrogenase [Gluconacetobacter azotocaptans]|uniref:D-2-hydroxyacid dehydrogenase n=1 Tax=Gluconacetobacter azotocaptans TaxID=142834 RepID=A0A7W4PHT2_9PROT|nr:D-2-hydroxyacid dehydrogenase [Gluconacetobacter azotocaptans]MBB2191431.1 D-2-hydroxyacid dehydrogenase [Gluconacetobacter azotocaptans]GBQ29682.1 D-isomer specific 2-hydroxyacid dehydrogenase NAD-binding protein [Gluconacetobacter azotocaptans DSM 13594]